MSNILDLINPDNMDNNDVLKYIFISVGSIYFTTTILKSNTSHLFAFIIIILAISFLQNQNKGKIKDFNEDLEFKLKTLNPKQPPEFMHLDANIISLLASIKDFKKFNSDTYKKIVESTDNMLHIYSDLKKGITLPIQNFEIAIEQGTLAINYMHSFIINLPASTAFNKKHEAVLERFQLLIKRNLDKMYLICKEQIEKEGINRSTKFISHYEGTKPSVAGAHHRINVSTLHQNYGDYYFKLYH